MPSCRGATGAQPRPADTGSAAAWRRSSTPSSPSCIRHSGSWWAKTTRWRRTSSALEDDVRATITYDGLVLSLGESVYTVRKADDLPGLRRLAATGAQALRKTEARRLANPEAGTIRPMEVDAVAAWILSSLRWQPGADAIRARLDAWAEGGEAKDKRGRGIQINSVDVEGMPGGAKLEIGRDRILRGTIRVGSTPIGAGAIVIKGSARPQAGVGDAARVLVDHPALDGVTIAKAVPNVGGTHRAREPYVQYALSAPARRVYHAGMVRCRPMDRAEADAITAPYARVERDAMARRMLDAMDDQERTRAIAMVMTGDTDKVPPVGGEPPMRLHHGDGRINASGSLSKSARWWGGAVRIDSLPEVVMMKLCSQAKGRLVEEIVDHPAIRGMRVRAVHRSEGGRLRPRRAAQEADHRAPPGG